MRPRRRVGGYGCRGEGVGGLRSEGAVRHWGAKIAAADTGAEMGVGLCARTGQKRAKAGQKRQNGNKGLARFRANRQPLLNGPERRGW